MPKIVGGLPADRWENEVLKAFKNQLPDDWVVMPSVHWTLAKNGYVRDGEADFVVLVPDSGLVVVEVKGSKAFKVGENGIWSRKESNGAWTELKEAPPEQAVRNMHDLTKVLNERYQWLSFPGRYSYLVIYPQGEAASLPAMFDESTIATRRHMNQLASRLRNSLEKRGGEGRGEQFVTQIVESVIDQLKNRQFHVYKADSGEDVADESERIEQLTRQQFASLKGLFQLPNVAVIGPAGSGKTVLAMWRLKALIDQGRRAVYICYNRALAASLRLQNPDYADFIWNVDKLFSSICSEARPAVGLDEFYREVLPGKVMDYADTYQKYDAIVVDEGQDLSEYQIIALLELLSSEGEWAFFSDWKQDLFNAGNSTPIGAEVVFSLHHNCRNTVKINEASNSYLNSRIESMPGMPVGVAPLVELANNQSMRAWEIAKKWSGEGSVVILSPYRYENSSMSGQISGHGLRLSTEISDLGEAGTVFFSTIKSFKGIEAGAIIVVDVGIPDEHIAFTKEDLYVAITRAKTRLALVTSRKDVADYYNEFT
ncbi:MULTISPECIES: nuclease-related domain-containing DEAD/DEAH box helicase [unclassified Marinobacter]|uniref:nuclease-related domain-containing DEAD/DEAH box helicase n=1 Tax=unclassified Marinobacter TaxID=83889 RepID=UPI0018F1D581|nr:MULTISPECIES: NERD domain-containing protein/DEAD/DEAH box helicase [unclassified Marinobacter]